MNEVLETNVQQGQLVLSSDEGVLLVDQHEPLLHHGLLLLLVVAWRETDKQNGSGGVHLI